MTDIRVLQNIEHHIKIMFCIIIQNIEEEIFIIQNIDVLMLKTSNLPKAACVGLQKFLRDYLNTFSVSDCNIANNLFG